MKLKKPGLLMKIERLKQLVSELSGDFSTLPQEMQYILRTAPQALSDLKFALKRGDKQTLREVHAVLEGIEVIINQAVGMHAGRAMAESIQSGASPDHSLPASRRLNQRMTGFLARHVDRKVFADLVREFCGKEAVQGEEIYMDPRGEMEAFSQWILFDKVLKGFSKRLAEVFAGDGELPVDERRLLEAHLQDHPSIYRVVKMDKENAIGKYLVEDLLSENGKAFNIKDRSTWMSLDKGAIFMGRAFPALDEVSVYLLLGSVTEIPKKLWERLSVLIGTWKGEFGEEGTGFFRVYHARIQNFIRGRSV